MQSQSLGKRVLSIVVAAQIGCAVILCVVALLLEAHTKLRALDETIQGRSDSVLGAIQDAEDPGDNVHLDPVELRLPVDDLFAVYNGAVLLGGSSKSTPCDLLALRLDGFRSTLCRERKYRVYQRKAMRIIDRAENGGVGLKRPVTILYAASESNLRHEVWQAAGVYFALILVIVAGTGFIVLVLLSRALRPLEAFAHATGELSVSSLVFAAPASVLAVSELRPLAEALSRVIDGLRVAFDKEKRFIGDAAHELKTAVAVIRSTVQLLMLKSRTVEEHAAGLSRVLEDVHRMELLVAQMLSSAGAESELGQAPAIDLSRMIEATVQGMQPVALTEGVLLSVATCEGAYVALKAERASVLISNLVLNAVQHSDTGMIVKIALSRVESDRIVLKVVDTGTGIGPAALPYVFDRFYREDRSRSRATGGAGLGLSICKSIVEGAGGCIAIESRPQTGTTVTVTFSAA